MHPSRYLYARLNSLSTWQAGLLIFLVAVVVRLTFVLVFHPYRDLARYELERTALSLAQLGVFGNPYFSPTGPTAHVSPGYTLVLAAIFRLFGTGVPAEIVKELLACAITALLCGLMPLSAQWLRLPPATGLWAGLVCAVFLFKPLVQVDGDWETPYTALFLLLLTGMAVQLYRNRAPSLKFAWLYGLTWGLALLFASVLLPIFFVLLLLGLAFHRGSGRRQYVVFSLLALLVVALCLAPWAIRNRYALGAPIITRSNFGLELMVSNNDEATADQRANYLNGVYARYHPLLNPTEAEQVKTLGEVVYNQQSSARAQAWIRAHPGRFIELCLGRVADFWFYPDPSRIKAAFGDLTG